MTTEEIRAFRNQLLKLEQHFKVDVATLEDEVFHRTDGKSVGNLSNIPVDDRAELGSNNYCEETTIGLFENESAQLEEINAALERIDAGAFGCCEACGRKIASGRLQTIPYARECIKCARKAQQGKPPSPGNL